MFIAKDRTLGRRLGTSLHPRDKAAAIYCRKRETMMHFAARSQIRSVPLENPQLSRHIPPNHVNFLGFVRQLHRTTVDKALHHNASLHSALLSLTPLYTQSDSPCPLSLAAQPFGHLVLYGPPVSAPEKVPTKQPEKKL